MDDRDYPEITDPKDSIRCRAQIYALPMSKNIIEKDKSVVIDIKNRLESEERLTIGDTVILQRCGIEYL